MSGLQLAWYLLLVVLALGYAALDGFDLGVGLLVIWAGNDRRRMAVMETVLPVWDGNEVWLLAAGGASFAAFPYVYAGLFSGLYLVFMLLFFSLIFRAVAMGFIHHETVGLLRWLWHVVLAVASGVALFALGLVLGNIMNGLPLNARGNWTGSHWQMFRALPVLMGFLAITLMMLHGALYLGLKVKGDLLDWARARASLGWGASVVLLVAAIGTAAAARTNLLANYLARPALVIIPALAVLALVSAGFFNLWRLRTAAFVASTLSILTLLVSACVGMFPRIIPAADEANSLLISTASSSPYTLKAMLIIAVIGVPIVLSYTAFVYWLFRQRVDHEAPSEGEGY